MVGVVTVQWFVAAGLPVFVVGYLRPPLGWEAVFFVALASYCFWTGYRAWKRGWKARFVLRLAIPICLFAISTCVVGLTKLLGTRV
jgi:hypothetical protein